MKEEHSDLDNPLHLLMLLTHISVCACDLVFPNISMSIFDNDHFGQGKEEEEINDEFLVW